MRCPPRFRLHSAFSSLSLAQMSLQIHELVNFFKNVGLFGSTSAVKGAILQGETEVGATLVGMKLLAVEIRDELKSALKEKFGSYEYLFFGIYSRKLQGTHNSEGASQDEVKPLTAANESGELIEVYRLS